MYKKILYTFVLVVTTAHLYSSEVSQTFAAVCAAAQKAADEECEKLTSIITSLDGEIASTDTEIATITAQLNDIEKKYDQAVAQLKETFQNDTDATQRALTLLFTKKKDAEKARRENKQKSEELRKKTAVLLHEFVVLDHSQQNTLLRGTQGIPSSPNAGPASTTTMRKPDLWPAEIWELLPQALQKYWGTPA